MGLTARFERKDFFEADLRDYHVVVLYGINDRVFMQRMRTKLEEVSSRVCMCALVCMCVCVCLCACVLVCVLCMCVWECAYAVCQHVSGVNFCIL